MIGSIEEIAYYMGYIDLEKLKNISETLSETVYNSYLKKMVDYESNTKEGVFKYDQK